MITFNGNPETVHFVNWILHSGYVDPAALVRKAAEIADAEARETLPDPPPDEYDLDITGALESLLEDMLSDWAADFAPDFNTYAEDSVEAVARGYPEQAYHGTDPHCLFGPLLLSAIGRIDLDLAAEQIRAHVNEAYAAEVA